MLPLPGNTNGGVDAAAEGDVIEGVEDGGEDVGVHHTIHTRGPGPYCNIQFR